MTKEELIKNLKYTMEKHKNDTVDTFGTNISLMCKDILDYLEQEPCDDCISRQAVLDMATTIQTDDFSGNEVIEVVAVDDIKGMQPVTPIREHGEWIQEEYWSEGCGMGESYGHWFRCSKCGKRVKDGYKKCGLNFCNKCGADMRKEQNNV